MTVGIQSAAIRSITSYPAATPVMKSRPDAPSISAATSAAGMIAVPGCVSIRKVSHLPPASIISEFANAAPPLVTLASAHQDGGAASHALFFAGDEPHRFAARRHPGPDERRREVLKRQSLDAIDNGGRKIVSASPTTHCANWRLRDLPEETRPAAVCAAAGAAAAADDGAMRAAAQVARPEPRKLRRSMCTRPLASCCPA